MRRDKGGRQAQMQGAPEEETLSPDVIAFLSRQSHAGPDTPSRYPSSPSASILLLFCSAFSSFSKQCYNVFLCFLRCMLPLPRKQKKKKKKNPPKKMVHPPKKTVLSPRLPLSLPGSASLKDLPLSRHSSFLSCSHSYLEIRIILCLHVFLLDELRKIKILKIKNQIKKGSTRALKK